jgi:hypothetical protein
LILLYLHQSPRWESNPQPQHYESYFYFLLQDVADANSCGNFEKIPGISSVELRPSLYIIKGHSQAPIPPNQAQTATKPPQILPLSRIGKEPAEYPRKMGVNRLFSQKRRINQTETLPNMVPHVSPRPA